MTNRHSKSRIITPPTPSTNAQQDTPVAKVSEEIEAPEVVEAEARTTPISVTPSAENRATLEIPAPTLGAGRPAADEAVAKGSGWVTGPSGLAADPDYRISLSDPRVERQHTASKAQLEALLKKLDGLHGEDEDVGPGSNTEEVPLSQEQLVLIRSLAGAALALHKPKSLPRQAIEALKQLFEGLASMQTMAKTLQIIGLLDVLTQAVEALGRFLVALRAL